jgi:16S rRNA (guanine966-N2)-methyltransferase
MADAGRVITGIAKGVRLLAPGEGTRPLSDKVKQALFASLESELGDAWPVPFLDLFAGSGAAGIEALSRGSPAAVFVERDERVARVIRQNLARAGFDRRAPDDDPALAIGQPRVVRSEAVRFLDGDARSAGGPFGAALVDPPYGDAGMLATLERLGDAERGWLATEAVVVAKRFWRDELPATVGILHRLRDRRFGETVLTFFRAGATGPSV